MSGITIKSAMFSLFKLLCLLLVLIHIVFKKLLISFILDSDLENPVIIIKLQLAIITRNSKLICKYF